jgi:hypothetical protein
MTEEDLLENLKRFDALPEDAVVKVTVAAAVLGTCAKTVRDHPHLHKVWVSSNRYGFRVGDIRKIVRERTLKRETHHIVSNYRHKRAADTDQGEVTA